MKKILPRTLTRIPFSFLWLLRRAIGKADSLLDLGCGDGALMKSLMVDKKWTVTGVDIFPKSVKETKKKGIYEKVICGDVVDITKQFVSEKKFFDVVFCSQVMEHLPREKGEKLLGIIDSLAKERIIILTPRGYMDQPEVFLEDNPHQVHQSGWTEEDFASRGYSVYGTGFKPVWSYSGWGRSTNKLVALLALGISFLASPLVYFVPSIASGLLCIKKL